MLTNPSQTVNPYHHFLHEVRQVFPEDNRHGLWRAVGYYNDKEKPIINAFKEINESLALESSDWYTESRITEIKYTEIDPEKYPPFQIYDNVWERTYLLSVRPLCTNNFKLTNYEYYTKCKEVYDNLHGKTVLETEVKVFEVQRRQIL